MEIDAYEYNDSETEYHNAKGYKIIKEKDYLDSIKFIKDLEDMGGDVESFIDAHNTLL